MKRFLLLALSILAGGLLAACTNTPQRGMSATPQSLNLSGANHKRLCDIPMTWTYKAPAANVPAKYLPLYGLWTGEVEFYGSTATMCIAVAVQEIHPDGKTDSIFNWNLNSNPESANQVSKGQANWWAQSVVVFPKKGEQLVFAAIAPYKGLWFRYILDIPTRENPNTITGRLFATKHGSKDDVSPATWKNETDGFRVTLRRNNTHVPFPIWTE